MAAELHRLRAYFAAPLFNEMERNFNLTTVVQLEDFVDVFLPQRDGGLLMHYVREGMRPDRAAQLIFDNDLSAMRAADVLIAVLDGSSVDEGVAFETGYMFALGKACVALQTDARRALPTGNNPMIDRSMRFVFQSVPQLLDWVRQVAEESRPPARLLTPLQSRSVRPDD